MAIKLEDMLLSYSVALKPVVYRQSIFPTHYLCPGLYLGF